MDWAAGGSLGFRGEREKAQLPHKFAVVLFYLVVLEQHVEDVHIRRPPETAQCHTTASSPTLLSSHIACGPRAANTAETMRAGYSDGPRVYGCHGDGVSMVGTPYPSRPTVNIEMKRGHASVTTLKYACSIHSTRFTALVTAEQQNHPSIRWPATPRYKVRW